MPNGIAGKFGLEQAGLELFLESETLALDVHGRNAKLIFRAEIRLDATSAALYHRPERRFRVRRRAPVMSIFVY
jgi:hypothetical protein